ncbi:MAG: hypothetical protein ABIY70_18360 [Capsulimonas sp.]|uniref:hypothetical protein n=1 Tax=Capsulimonas sp. TaxID=2494211 RepID=UPI003265EB88
MIPVLGGALHPPVYAAVGIAMITHGKLHWWYGLIWLLLAFGAYHAISYAGNLGARNHRRH